MMQWIEDAPYLVTYLFFFLGAMIRANTTYWIGRSIAAGVKHTRFQRVLRGPIYLKSQALLARWGVFAVPLSFLTVGVQTAVNATAGITRMPLRRYLPAVIVGCLIWALVYTTVGLAFIYAWIALDWPWLVGIVLLVALVLWLILRRRKRARRVIGPEEIK